MWLYLVHIFTVCLTLSNTSFSVLYIYHDSMKLYNQLLSKIYDHFNYHKYFHYLIITCLLCLRFLSASSFQCYILPQIYSVYKKKKTKVKNKMKNSYQSTFQSFGMPLITFHGLSWGI